MAKTDLDGVSDAVAEYLKTAQDPPTKNKIPKKNITSSEENTAENQNDEDDEEDYFEKNVTSDPRSYRYNQKSESKKSNGTLGIVLFFSALVIAALFISFSALNLGENTIMLDLPVIKTFCTSSSDNEAHDINAKFSIKGDKNAINSIGEKVIYDDVKSALTKIDYTQIPENNSDEYVKQYVQDYLNTKYNDIKIDELYLTEFSTGKGTKIQKDNDPGTYDENRNNRQNFMDGISNWNR